MYLFCIKYVKDIYNIPQTYIIYHWSPITFNMLDTKCGKSTRTHIGTYENHWNHWYHCHWFAYWYPKASGFRMSLASSSEQNVCKCVAALVLRSWLCFQRIPEAFWITVSLWWWWGVETLEMCAGSWSNVWTTETWMRFRFGANRSVWSPVRFGSQNGSPCHKFEHASIRGPNKGTIYDRYKGPTKGDRKRSKLSLMVSCFSMPLACRTVSGTCHPQRLGIIVDLYLAVLIAEKVTICLIDRWKCHNLGFWIVSGQHPMVASIQILITKV